MDVKNYIYPCDMENTINTQNETQGVEFWENELAYFENAMDGLRTSYAVIEQMHKHAQSELAKLVNPKQQED